MPLELTDAVAQIVHLNLRKEGPEENKTLAVDVKFEVESNDTILAAFDPTLRSAFFRVDSPDLRFPAMGPYPWSGEMLHMELQVNKLAFRDATLKKFVLDPYINAKSDRCVKLTFSAAIAPTGREVAVLAEMVQDAVMLTVSQESALDLGPGGREPDGALDGVRAALIAKGAKENPDGSLDVTPAMSPGMEGTVYLLGKHANREAAKAKPKAAKKAPRKGKKA